MRRALASGTLVGFSLTAIVAFGQSAAPPAPSAPSAPAASAAPTAKAAPAPAASAAPPASAAPAPSASAAPAAPAPSAAPPAPSAAPPAAPPTEAAPPPPVSAAPAAAAPSTPVAAGTPSTVGASPPASPPVDRGVEKQPKKQPDPWQDAHALGVEGSIGVSGRIGPSSIEPSEEERFGVGFDLSTWLTLSTEYLIGFGLSYTDVGSVSTASGVNEFRANYSVTSTYLGARAFPWRKPNAELFVGLRIGLAWQGVDATGVRSPPDAWDPQPFACSGGSGPGVALGAGIGGAIRLGARAWLTGHLDANGYKVTSDVVDDCAVGIGSVTNASLGAGILYAFDLGRDAKLDAGKPPSAQTW